MQIYGQFSIRQIFRKDFFSAVCKIRAILPVVQPDNGRGSLIAIVYGKQRKSSENIRDNNLLID